MHTLISIIKISQTLHREIVAVCSDNGKRQHTVWAEHRIFNPLTPNDHYSSRTAPLVSKRCILHIYSTNIRTEYFKHGIYSPFFFSSKCSLFHNSKVFGSCVIHILFTGCAKIKENNSGAKRLIVKPGGLSHNHVGLFGYTAL